MDLKGRISFSAKSNSKSFLKNSFPKLHIGGFAKKFFLQNHTISQQIPNNKFPNTLKLTTSAHCTPGPRPRPPPSPSASPPERFPAFFYNAGQRSVLAVPSLHGLPEWVLFQHGRAASHRRPAAARFDNRGAPGPGRVWG